MDTHQHNAIWERRQAELWDRIFQVTQDVVTLADSLEEKRGEAVMREELLRYASPLETATERFAREDVTIAGEVIAELFAATTGTDADWIVKLIDVYPQDWPSDPRMGGYQLMVANEVFRGRFRDSFERPSAIVPNRVTRYRFSLHDQNYRFKRGHKIMVQVQSTWFPLIDRNPQTFVPNIFEAKESDFRSATMRIYRSPQFASGVTIPVVETARP
jgi:predicted acyl esterase